MIFHEQPTDPWIDFDFMLIEAYQILQEETCGECGNPVWVCRNEDADWIGFKVKTSICFAKEEMDKWRSAQEKKKNYKPKPGAIHYPIAFSYDDRPMPSRFQFYKSLSDKVK
jgi:hypothetical protein